MLILVMPSSLIVCVILSWERLSNALVRLVFSDGTQPLEWSLRAILGSQVLRHCHRTERPQTSAEYLAVYPRQPESSWSATGVL